MKSRTSASLMLAALLSSSGPGAAAQSFDLARNLYSLSSSEISAMGASRLGDVLSRLPGIRATSVDGFTQQLSILGVSSSEHASPVVFVDGQAHHFSMLGLPQYNLVPVALSEIDSISYSPFAMNETALLPRSGRIDIRRKKRKGLFLQAHLAGVNEIDDPGPYRYTSDASPNVDRSGPSLQLLASSSSEHWYSRLLLRSDEHHVTDEHVASRVPLIYDGKDSPRLHLRVMDLLFSRSDSLGTHSFQIGTSTFKDLLYRRANGYELPLVQRWVYVTGTGDVELTTDTRIGYSIALESSTASERQNSFPFGPELRRNKMSAELALRHKQAFGSISARIGLARFRYTSGNPGANLERVYEDHTLPVIQFLADWKNASTRHFFSVLLSKAPLAPGSIFSSPLDFSLAWDINWQIKESIGIAVGIGYDRSRQPDSESFFQLVQSSVPIPVFEQLFSNDRATEEGKRHSSSARLQGHGGLRMWIRPGVEVQFLAFVRSVSNLRFSQSLVDLENRSAYVFPDWSPIDRATGSILGYSSQIKYSPGVKSKVAMEYSWAGVIGKNETRFGDYYSGAMGNRISAQAWFFFNPRFRLYLSASYSEGNQWNGYTENSLTKTTSSLVLDITVQKELWSEYLLLSASVLNLTNQSYASHPAGGIDHLMVRVMLQFTIRDSEKTF